MLIIAQVGQICKIEGLGCIENRARTKNCFLAAFNSAFTANLHPIAGAYVKLMLSDHPGLVLERSACVILVTRLNGSKFFINAELIRTIESTPDTVITLVDDMKLVVKEAPELVVERIVEYHRKARAPFSTLDSLD